MVFFRKWFPKDNFEDLEERLDRVEREFYLEIARRELQRTHRLKTLTEQHDESRARQIQKD